MEVAGWGEGELASGLSTTLSGICQRAEEEWSNTSHSFSLPRSAVWQQLILIGGNVQRGKEDIVSTCSRSVVYFNYFLINLSVAVQLHHVMLRRFWICRLKQNVTRAGRRPPAQNNNTFVLLCCAAGVFQVVQTANSSCQVVTF